MDLTGQRVVVIGGTSGIGFAVARAAMADGAEVIVASSQISKVEAAVARLGEGAGGHAVNVKDEPDVAAFFEQIGGFHHLVFTAGDWGGREARGFAEVDLTRAAELASVRYWGAVAAIKHGHGSMAPNGSIVLTNGTIAHRPRKGTPLSTAMAGSIEFLTRALAVDLAPLRVNAVCCGLIRTEVWNSIPEAGREERFQQMTARQPLPRIGEPDEAAQAYLYLMRGGYTTGQVLRVDGGGTLV